MKVPLEWMKEYVVVRLSPGRLAHRLTMAGLEVVGTQVSESGPVFDVEITPNRADCLSIIGVAREVAAMTGQRLKDLGQGTGDRGQGRAKIRSRTHDPHPKIVVEDRRGCPRYIGRLMKGVQIAPSPAWMQRRLMACGCRPINNVVDITNYVLLEYGQPLHAFDFDRLAQGTILVRRATSHESLTTLDGVRRALSSKMLVIADAKQPVAIAGIMGGMGSEVTPQTTTVLLESARFDPMTVRRTARQLGLVTESSYRFERGVDPEGVETASRRAAALLTELAGGSEVACQDVGVVGSKRLVIALDLPRLSRWLGMRVDPPTVRTTLARLSCRVASSGSSATLHVIPPSFRQDLAKEVDLFEEVARMLGYDRIPLSLPARPLSTGGPGEAVDYTQLQSLKNLCVNLGLTEVMTWSLVSDAELGRLGYSAAHAVRLANPLSQDHAYLRPTLLMGLLQTIRRNLTQGAPGVCVFEVGGVIVPLGSAAGREGRRLGMALAGLWSRDWHQQEPCDFFRLKGLVEAVVTRSCEGTVHYVSSSYSWAESGSSAEIRLSGRPIGIMGQVARAALLALDVEHKVWVAELSLEALGGARRSLVSVAALSTFPPAKRDLSIFLKEQLSFEAVCHTIQTVGEPLARHVELVDRYTGRQVPTGMVSLTFSIEYRDPARTLTAAEVDTVHQRIGQTLTNQFGATLR